ncbi:MAG: PorV/PorQ family protein [Elusimicrobia bacterium]|nr:PorV/PorQ family protein [Elusimicrobiota bacterium]
MKKEILLVSMVIGWVGGFGSLAQAGRTDSFEFLRLPTGARTSALGGAGVAEATGLAGIQINPAGLGRIWRDEVSLSGARWIDDVDVQNLGFAHPFMAGGALAGGLTTLSYGDIPGYSPTGGSEGNVNARDTATRLGYGRNFGSRWAWGVQGTYAQEQLAGTSAHALVLDGGGLWSPARQGPLKTLTFGAAFRHWGQNPKFQGKNESLPRSLQAGVNFRPFFEGLSVSVDGLFPAGQSPSLVAGVEYWARDAAAFRVGFNGREAREGSGVTLGLGFRAWDLDVDYGYVPLGALGEIHHLGITYRFGNMAEKHYARGVVSLQSKDYAQAVIHFARAISKNPDHRRALIGLRDANALLQKQNITLTP